MSVFLIVPADEDEKGIGMALEAKIKEVIPSESDRFMLPGRCGCFVSFNGISTELRDKLNLNGEIKHKMNAEAGVTFTDTALLDSECTAVIINVSVGTYNGYALTTLWEWLNLKTKE